MASLSDHRQHGTVAHIRVDERLFVWRGGGIVLFGEADGDRWIVSRGWLGPDTLSDVRCWKFATPEAFGGQFRRLAREATGDPRQAQTLGASATRWALAAE